MLPPYTHTHTHRKHTKHILSHTPTQTHTHTPTLIAGLVTPKQPINTSKQPIYTTNLDCGLVASPVQLAPLQAMHIAPLVVLPPRPAVRVLEGLQLVQRREFTYFIY